MNRTPGRRARPRVAAVIILVTSLWSLPAVPAQAVPENLASRPTAARRVQAQVASLDNDLEIVIERYNEAASALARTRDAVAETEHRLARARKRLAGRQRALSHRVRGIYREGDVDFLEVVLSTSDFLDFLQQLDMLLRIGVHDATIVSDIKATRRALTKDKKQLTTRLTERRRVAARVASEKAEISRRLAERERMLAGVKREIAVLKAREAAEQARRRAAAAARLRRGGGAAGSASGGSGTYHPTGKSHADAVRVAFAQLGKPYSWGASGPHAFDCSGLTMYCYGQIGISLPHSSSGQYSSGERVGRSELEPGDLVFFGSPIHHVGIYIGGGEYIHAPNTGDVVKISDLDRRGDFVGGARP